MKSLHDVLTRYCYLPSDSKSESHLIMEVVDDYGLRKVVSEIEFILKSGSSEEIRNTLTFLRDCSLFRKDYPKFTATVSSFREAIPKSRILKIMYRNLNSPEMLIRDWTVYSLGKMGFNESITPLRKVIPKYIQESPEVLFRLLFEIFWLEENTDYKLLLDLTKLQNLDVNKAICEYFEISKTDNPIEEQKRKEILGLIGMYR